LGQTPKAASPTFSPPARFYGASTTSVGSGGGGLAEGAGGGPVGTGPGSGGLVVVPTDLCYGARIGIRSCCEQRYVAALLRSSGGSSAAGDVGFDVEVSGFHPFRQGDAADRAADCPSEWVVLQYAHRQHRGAIRLGDEVCFAKELTAVGERRSRDQRERYAYLALEPSIAGDAMEVIVDRKENSDLNKWTVVHADDPNRTGTFTSHTPLLIRGKYNECLSLGRFYWELGASSGGGSSGNSRFRPPVRSSGRTLVCQGRDGKIPERRFRIVKAVVPFSLDMEPDAKASASWLPVGHSEGRVLEPEALGELMLVEQERALVDDILCCLLGVDGLWVHRSSPATLPGPAGGVHSATLPLVQFEIEAPPGADVSNLSFLKKILPLCGQVAALQHFVKVQGQYEYGTVNHALCAAMRDLLREFAIKITQFEHSLRAGALTIARLWCQLQPSIDTFTVLHRVASRVYGCIGGPVLNGIEEVMSQCSLSTAQDLCEFLLQQASRPYFETVSQWIYEGRLEDPYREFFIFENSRVRDERFGGPAAGFWQKHFVLEERAVPHFLSTSREKILHAGKYLHVFFSAASGKESSSRELPEPGHRSLLRYSRRRRDYVEVIDAAYRRASAALLGLFMRKSPEGLDLPGRLRSMRSFFFLAKGDWFGQLIETATLELEQPAAEVPLARLEGLLDLAVRASSAASDPYREDISCGMHSFRIEDACIRMCRGQALPAENDDDDAGSSKGSVAGVAGGVSEIGAGASSVGRGTSLGGTSMAGANLSLAGESSGVRCFTLKYRTAWPLSIVFSRELLLKYQVIFRHLLYCRYVERKLVEVWLDHQFTKELGLDTSLSPSYSLRQRMLHFCRDYIYYATIEVLEPQSHSFLDSLSQVETIDEVLMSHERFLNTCLQELLLTEREGLYRHLSKVLQTCLTFAYTMHRFNHNFGDVGEDARRSQPHSLSRAVGRMERVQESTQTYLALLSQRHYSKMISKFKVIFESQLQGFLRQIQQESTTRYDHFLSNLATRLDYNDYYSSVLESTGAAVPSPDADATR